MNKNELACKVFGHKVFDDEVSSVRPWTLSEFATLGSDAFAHDDCLRCGARQAWASADAGIGQIDDTLLLWHGDRDATVVHVSFGAGSFARPSGSEGLRHEDDGVAV